MALSDNYDLHKIGMDLIDISKEVVAKPEFRKRIQTDKGEIVTLADTEIEDRVEKYLLDNEIPVNMDGEEKRRRTLTSNPLGFVVFDPIDGTDNAATDSFHYCTIPSIFDTPKPKNLGSAVWAGIYDHVSGNLAYLNNGKVFSLKNNQKLELEKGISSLEEVSISDGKYLRLILDTGPGETSKDLTPYDELLKLSWRKNISCAGYHFMEIATGARDVFICPVQKPEELVAGIPLIEKMGGAVITFNGKRAGDLPYDFDERYKMIAARTPELADEVRHLIEY